MTHTEQRGALQRMDNIAIVVDDLAAAKAFFTELGMELEGEATLEGSLVDRLIRLDGVRTDIAMMRTPNGHGRIELTKYHTPASPGGDQSTPVNALGMHRIMFAVYDIEDVLDRLKPHGAELVGEVVQYEDRHRLAYLRGPAGIFVALAEQIG
ncbi:VOC family protein [Qaidamihabitans albus]|uniref:VOC family protein n=1 Tax=Qaidamihabitans albus TaxID=2795733 RepID=UPI001F458413|nr:VOC family protein [Qaidamihabitans albus]